MSRAAGLVALCLVTGCLAALCGCVGGSQPARSYYTLDYPMGEQVERYEAPRYPHVVRVRAFDSLAAYDKQEIVYRTNPYEYQYYWYRLWAAKPRKMLFELVAAHLRESNLFREVIQSITDRLPDFDLECEVLAIEELDAAPREWYAHLHMRCTLVRFVDNVAIWEFAFDEKAAVHEQKPVFVVQALSRIMEEQMGRMVTELDGHFASQAPPADSLRPSAVEPPGGAPPVPRTRPEPKARLKR